MNAISLNNIIKLAIIVFLVILIPGFVVEAAIENPWAKSAATVTESPDTSDTDNPWEKSAVTVSRPKDEAVLENPWEKTAVTVSRPKDETVLENPWDETAFPLNGPQYGMEPTTITSPPGEPRVTYSTPSGYAPATALPLTIKKTVKGVEEGKGYANRLRVDVEITSAKKNSKNDAINNIDIYELVDESLNLVPPADSLNEIKRLDCKEQLTDISDFGSYRNISEIPLMNYYKASSLNEISSLRLALLRDMPLSATDPKSYKKMYVNPDSEPQFKCYCPLNNTNEIFCWNKDMNNSSNCRNLSMYLKDTLGIEWLNSSNIIPKYPGCDSIQLDNVKFTDKDCSDNWVLFIIEKNRSEGRVLLNISDKMTYYLTFEKNKTNPCLWNISDRNEIMRFNVKSLSSKDQLFYWYYVKPKKSGSFNTQTLIRIKEEDYKGWPDIIYPYDIIVGKPDYRFEVQPILKESRVYANSWSWLLGKWTKLDITYIIRYTGDASYTYLKKINIEFKPGDGRLSGEITENKNFENNDIISLNRQIGYDSSGTYQIPAVWIEGNPYIFKETVTVRDPISDLWDFINLYVLILGAVTAFLTKKFLPCLRKLKSSVECKMQGTDEANQKSPTKLYWNHISGDEENKDTVIEGEDTKARDNAAKKMADIIIEALERGAREKR